MAISERETNAAGMGPSTNGVRIALGMLILLHPLALIPGVPHLWGLDQWKYLEGPWVWPVLVLGALLLLPPVGRLMARPLGKLDIFATRKRESLLSLTIYFLLLSAAAVILWAFRNETHFLGDGYLWANHLPGGAVFREPASTWLYRIIYRALNAAGLFGEVNPVRSSAITSVLAGLVFVVFARKTAMLLAERRGDYFLVVAALVSCGTVMLFFGYVETYPPVAAGVIAFVYFSLRCLRRGGSPVPAVAAFILMTVLHLSAIALLPGLLLLLHYRAGKEMDGRRLKIFSIAATAAGLIALWLLRATGLFGGFFREHFLPLFSSSSMQDVAYPLFSPRALFDYLNEIVLVAPLAVLVPFLLIGRRRRFGHGGTSGRGPGESCERAFLGTCAFFYFVLFAVFNKTIGTSRDWDLFAPMAIPFVLWIVMLIRERFIERRGELAVLAVAVILTHTAPWILLNADAAGSEERFIDLCENGYWSNRAKGYGYSTVGQYYRHYGKTLPAIYFYGRAAKHDPGNVRYNYYAGEMYSNLGKHAEALEYYFKVLERDGLHLQALNNAGVSYLEMGRPAEAEPYLQRALEVDPGSAGTMRNLGYIYLVTGRTRDAVGMYLSAVELEPANAAFHIDLAKAFIAYGDTESARRHVEAARSIDPNLPEDLFERMLKDRSFMPPE